MIWMFLLFAVAYLIQGIRFRRRVPLAMTVFMFSMCGLSLLVAYFYVTGVFRG